tara:strand:+ start:287 stop:562 length:276 start_codon:yes stop_codon:yes gene_type:complete
MASRKQTKKDQEGKEDNFTSSPPPPDSNQDRINELVKNAYENGKAHGSREALEGVHKFLKDKSVEYFMDNKDDVAKLVRDLCNDVKNAMPK